MSKRAEERALEEYGPQNDALFPGDGNDNKARRIGFIQGYKQAEKDLLEVSDMKSPFTGGKVLRGMEKKTITFRGEEYIVPQRFFKCQDSGIEFTNAAIDDDNIWEVIKAYFNRKEISPFDLIGVPSWCGYPKDLCCMSLSAGYVTGEDYCKDCDAYKGNRK